MNPKFTVQLTQHTPLIHFQHDQAGVTLRATEVKAKLDKFLIKNMGGWPSIEKEWKVNPNAKDNFALDYKMRIHAVENRLENPDRKAKGYFGNMGNSPDKYLVSCSDVTLTIFCFSPDLRTLIKENISDFFLTHNFATRQNRGFGSFTLAGEKNRPSSAQYAFHVYKDYVEKSRNKSFPLVTMEVIDWFYKSLRQGINHGTFDNGFIPWLYMKPMLFQFAASKGIQWEKKTIKEWFFNEELEGQKRKHDQEDELDALYYSSTKKRLVRDLFGLSTEQTWMNYPGHKNKPSVEKKDADKKIERFPSPLRFKPVHHQGDEFMTVYFWAVPIADEYRSASFKLEVDKRENSKPALKIWEDFDMDQFFEFAFAENRLENSIQQPIHPKGEPIEDLLINIYRSIRENTYIL